MSVFKVQRDGRTLEQLFITLLFIVAGLAISRLLYEGLFPRFLWLGRPLPVFFLTAVIVLISWLVWRVIYRRVRWLDAGKVPDAASVALLPLLLNLLYLLDPAVNLTGSRFLFAASVWLMAVFLTRQLAPARYWSWLGILFIWLALIPIYLSTMPHVVGRADTFEFQVVIPQLGIAHPTGYPLYILIGRLFAALPFGSVAWRINLASAIFAASAAGLLFLAGRRFWKEPISALLASVLYGLTPTLWSQAVEAEVYALHALYIAAALWLMAIMLDHGGNKMACSESPSGWSPLIWQRLLWMLALLLGLGLTNHLTMLIIIPAALLAVWLAYGRCLRSQSWRANGLLLMKVGLAFLLPLLLYAYLPLRWVAIHDEPMGWSRFFDWVIGGRFQGALQLTAWLTDLTRYNIVWRLLLAEWGWFNLFLAFWGALYATGRNWRVALVLLVTWIGYIFYALNYHVPDLAVFLIPAYAVIALFWGAGLIGALAITGKLIDRWGRPGWRQPLSAIITLIFILPVLMRIIQFWPDSKFRDQVALQSWGEGVLAMPMARNATILADSEKIAPLYYLQQAEGFRPDLNIMVLPDEAAYRAEIDTRLSAGETVYLARFLPGLEGIYHLRSLGPLIEVSSQPLHTLPLTAVPSDLRFDGVRLLGYEVEEPAAVDPNATAITLYWQADGPSTLPRYVYARWSGSDYEGHPAVSGGAHPAGNFYPTVAWHPDEIVPDYHLLTRPQTGVASRLKLQVAIGPKFAAPGDLDWETVTSLDVEPATSEIMGQQFRAQNGRMLLTQAGFPVEIRPGTPLPLALAGYAPHADTLSFKLLPLDQEVDREPRPGTLIVPLLEPEPIRYMAEVDTDLPNGDYFLLSSDPLTASFCGWLASPSAGCVLGEVAVSGVPLPQDAHNFDNKLTLLAIDIPDGPLQPGGVLPVQLQWQSLAAMEEDYTVFLQVLNDRDQIVGQIDAWPVQGTYPTSQWRPGEMIDDPYEIQLDSDLPPGDYRLQVGLYLLSTLRRLPLLDDDSRPVDDNVVLPGLTVEK